MKPKNYFNKILVRSFSKSWSNIMKFKYSLVIKDDIFPVSGKLLVYGLIEKKEKEELLINSSFLNLRSAEDIDDWFALELAKLLQNHKQWTK